MKRLVIGTKRRLRTNNGAFALWKEIDEYDKPILDSMFKPYSKDILELMADFYQRLKSANDKERFVFITGVTKFAHVSLFSGANNIKDLTRDKNFATMLGYTEVEMRNNFSEHIDAAASELEMSRDDLLHNLKLNYNGVRMQVKSQRDISATISALCSACSAFQTNARSWRRANASTSWLKQQRWLLCSN
ncbi:MAG: AAA family ATPase [Paludibacteraceae bacterium]|nr:AAA family ATPase [Paludibacteraceae bacterium]